MLEIWLTFIAQLFSALAWPVAVVVIVFALRKPIERIIPAVRELQFGPMTMKIGEEVEEARELADEVKTEELPEIADSEADESLLDFMFPPTSDTRIAFFEKQRKLLSVSPEAAIASAWIDVESEFMRLVKEYEFNPRSPISKNLTKLREASAISKNTVQLFKELRAIRNKTLHSYGEKGVTLDVFTFANYYRSAHILIEALKKARVEYAKSKEED